MAKKIPKRKLLDIRNELYDVEIELSFCADKEERIKLFVIRNELNEEMTNIYM